MKLVWLVALSLSTVVLADIEIDLGGNGSYPLYCASGQYRYQTCTPQTKILQARLMRQDSAAACVEGRSWGFTRDFLWVDRGCRGQFLITPPPSIIVRQIHCASGQYRRNTCPVGGRLIDVRLLRQVSSAPCQEGRTFGATADGVWVDRGCRGEFQVRLRLSPHRH